MWVIKLVLEDLTSWSTRKENDSALAVEQKLSSRRDGFYLGLFLVRWLVLDWEGNKQYTENICPSLDKSKFWKLPGRSLWKCCSLLRRLLGKRFTLQCGSGIRIIGGIIL